MSKKKGKKPSGNTIALNKKAKFDFALQDRVEAGLSLQGWEVKSLRQGKVQLTDTYVLFKNGEAWLLGAHISPLPTASTHFVTDPTRTRKLLLKRKEIAKLQAAAEQKGYTVVATALYWKKHLVKCEVALGKGKQEHDKRETEKERDWNRQKRAIMKDVNR
ncbi:MULTISPECIES: SsrA-binding protein SmpB [Marinimicrobium]|jgi:SsrA-binding protein|uniref:SsrA-binding protein n=1 Tax=Marinimicrobium koreense TaxID=306545 RepID=A0A3N1NY69_9GAMM|nr:MULTISPECIES: SsrA-binding protein SmpB [Marinimicrobium]MAN50583.1 SsrA-binding protein SmpB [Marinimicrobium sp.]ROQ21143.1 SsrA-binding protein [Marinimicrobium koreense]